MNSNYTITVTYADHTIKTFDCDYITREEHNPYATMKYHVGNKIIFKCNGHVIINNNQLDLLLTDEDGKHIRTIEQKANKYMSKFGFIVVHCREYLMNNHHATATMLCKYLESLSSKYSFSNIGVGSTLSRSGLFDRQRKDGYYFYSLRKELR